MIKNILNKLSSLGSKDYVDFEGLKLPKTRSNQGLSNHKDYVNSGIEQINFLVQKQLITPNTEVLDFGCGQGRLLNTLKYSKTAFGHYTGLDTASKSLNWCKKYLQYADNINFIHLAAENARYNADAKGLQALPFEQDKFDLIFLNSVFSHMLADDISFYLSEFHKVLKPTGFVYLTAFVEENVAAEEENPDNYLEKSTGALHRVRFEKNYFFGLIQDQQFEVHEFHHQLIDRTKQSVVVLKKKDL